MSFRTFCGDAKAFLLVVLAVFFFSHLFPIGSSFVRFKLILGVPLVGVLVRYRVHYSPKETKSADAAHTVVEGGERQEDDEKVRGYVHMLRRVYSIEHWGGLYKSTIPTILFWFATSFIWSIIPRSSIWRIAQVLDHFLPSSVTSLVSFATPTYILVNTIGLIFFVPVVVASLILTVRAVTTDAKLPFFSLSILETCNRAINVLTTPEERASPFRAFFSPRIRGVIFCQLLRELYVLFVFQPIRNLITTGDGFVLRFLPVSTAPEYVSVANGAAYFALLGISSVLLCPLDVVKARLCVLYPGELSEPDMEQNAVKEGTLIHLNEDEEGCKVSEKQNIELQEDTKTDSKNDKTTEQKSSQKAFRLRPQPYTGFRDCIQTITSEEGTGTLWRAWWATCLGLI